MDLMAAMIVAGWDEKHGGQVFSLPIGGTMVPVSWAVDGSGSVFIHGFIDAEYRHGMSRAEAEAFVTRAISLAMARDGSSGGLIRLVVVRAAESPRDRRAESAGAGPDPPARSRTDTNNVGQVDEKGAERKMIAGADLPVHREELPHLSK